MSRPDLQDFWSELGDIQSNKVPEDAEDGAKTPDEGEQEAAWLEQAGLGMLVHQFQAGKELSEDEVNYLVHSLPRNHIEVVKRRVDTLNATLRKKQKYTTKIDVRNIFPQQPPSNEPTSTTEHQLPARPSTLPRGLKLQATNGQTSRGGKKTSTSPRGEVVHPEWAEQRSQASRGRQGSLMKNKGGYSMTGLSEEVQDNLESGVATLSVYQTGTNHTSLGQLSPISDRDITFEFSIMEHNGDSSPLRGEVTIPSLLSHEVGLPNFMLVPDPLGLTRITDISPTDVTHVKNFALLELTSMYDTHNISYTRRRSKKRYKEHGIFGVPLQTLLEHDQKLAPDTRVPIVYQEILHYLSKNCLDTEGILRIPGSSTRIKTLRQEMEEKFYQGTFVWGPDLTPNDVAALMKQFLRDLPVPLLTDEYIDAFAQVEELPDKKQQLHALNLLVILLPSVHRDTLGALLDLLLEIISHSDTNKMSLNNVAMIMAPNLFLAPKIGNANIGKNKDALDLEIKMARGTSNIVRMIIRYKHILWTIPTYLLGLVRRQYEQEQVRRNKEKSKMKFLAKKDKTDVYKKPALKHEADFQEGVIRVQAPALTKSSTAIQLDQSMTAGDIISRFTVSPLKTDSKKSSSKDKKFIAADVDTYLYEVGGNIGERCLPDNTNMLALYKVNPNAEWVLKHRQRLKAV